MFKTPLKVKNVFLPTSDDFITTHGAIREILNNKNVSISNIKETGNFITHKIVEELIVLFKFNENQINIE